MTKGRNQHVAPRDGGWAVKPEGFPGYSELFVHGPDGRIREWDSHSHEPNPPKGGSLACPHGAGPRKHRNM
jgi:hypothetical protein